MKKHAVIIAGDFRTFEFAAPSAYPLFESADIYVSIWNSSNFKHRVDTSLSFNMAEMHEARVREILRPHKVVKVKMEEYNSIYWESLDLNSNFLHRLRQGVDMVKASGTEYDSVLCMRPDLFFGEISQLVKAVRNVSPGQFITILSSYERVNVQLTLNDTLFAVHSSDLDRAVPTVDYYAASPDDWHHFLRKFVVETNRLDVVDVHAHQSTILRPPAWAGMKYSEALFNSNAWDNVYIYKVIDDFSVNRAIKDWGDAATTRAVRALLKP